MFKSSFAKHITAFVVIIFLSFMILAGIIGTITRQYSAETMYEKLDLTSEIVVEYIEDEAIESVENAIKMGNVPKIVKTIVEFDSLYNVMILDPEGEIMLTTLGGEVEVGRGLGSVDFSLFNETKSIDGVEYSVHNGKLGGLVADSSVAYMREIVINDSVAAHIVTLASTAKNDALVNVIGGTIINSSVWVMLAAVIAVYFITERIINPLRVMTSAAKEMSKGNFSTRIPVYGKDEVSELSKAFNDMAESLDSLEKMRNSFLANVSHDLRTPMTTISGFIDGITSGVIPPEKHEYYLGIISEEVHRLSRLVGQLLDISRLESGERKFNMTEFDIAEMARIVLISFEQRIEEKHLDVEFDSDDDMLVLADRDSIHQVIYNLCHNAIKFANDGGRFSIKISRVQDKKIKVSVFDEGQSIPDEDKKLVFDRFYKTDKSRGLDKSGVGLGLYISKTIIEAHGEKIWVESVEGESCEFIFTLKEAPVQNKEKAIQKGRRHE